MPFVALLRLQAPNETRQALREVMKSEAGPALLRSASPTSRTVVIAGIDEPREMNLYREGTDFSPPYDLALETNHPDACSFLRNLDSSGLPTRFSTCWVYETDEHVVKDERPGNGWPDGEIPGIRVLHPLRFHADLSPSALLRSWREIHADLAPKAHSGGSFYQQRLVVRTLSKDAAPFGGFSEFQFPTFDALLSGYFASPAARDAVRHDIRHFIDGVPPRLFGTALQYSRAHADLALQH